MSKEGQLKRGEMYYNQLIQKTSTPTQVTLNHPDVLFFLSNQEKLTDPPKAEPKVSKKKEVVE